MCKLIKFAFAVVLLLVAAVAMCDAKALHIVVEKTAEGLLGGMTFGLIAGLDKWLRLREHRGMSLCRFRCLLWHEVKTGLCAGFLVGAILSVLAILAR